MRLINSIAALSCLCVTLALTIGDGGEDGGVPSPDAGTENDPGAEAPAGESLENQPDDQANNGEQPDDAESEDGDADAPDGEPGEEDPDGD